MRVSALALAFASAVCLTAPAFAGGGGGGGGSGSGSSAGNRIQAGFTIGEDGTISTGSGNSGGHGAPAGDGHGAPAADDGHGAPSGSPGEGIADDNPRMVSLPMLVVPLSRDNHLTGYGFVTVRFVVSSGFDHWDIREHAHFALDRLIRASHRNSIATADGLNIDAARAEEVWREALSEEFGAGVVDTMSFDVPDIRRVGR
ncbi:MULTISPECIES: hypothetical protein [Hyphobacterium]|uniref:Uncharacterized protein n=1 Tax=Hyphobacterium vulgare TaxID=1736751 RepID=A0ABV6ZTC8_9PROT